MITPIKQRSLSTHPYLAPWAREIGVLKGAEIDPYGKVAHDPGAKLDTGKTLAATLLDFGRALEKIAEVSTFGAKKYTRGGWETVPNGIQRYEDAAIRHLLKVRHERFDADSGLPHLHQAAWNLLAVIELLERENG